MGAAVFAETGFWVSARIIKGIKVAVRPSYFLPLAYITNSEVSYSLSTTDGEIKAGGSINASVYAPLSIEPGGAFSIGNVGDMLGKGGGDLTLGVEYPLFNDLNLGASFTHIPIFPARLSDGYNLKTDFSYYQDIQSMLDDTPPRSDMEEGFHYNEPSLDPFSDAAEQTVFRPFKVGFSALYRPFGVRLFSLKPQVALVFNGIYNTPVYVDFGGTAELNLGNIFIVDAGVNFEVRLWKNTLGLIFNMRALELDLNFSTQSQDFLKSFQAAGFRLDVGIRMGW
jgi:hypothetical protein